MKVSEYSKALCKLQFLFLIPDYCDVSKPMQTKVMSKDLEEHILEHGYLLFNG